MIARHATRLTAGRPFPPFGDAVADLWVLGKPLPMVQDEALAANGVQVASVEDRPHLEFADHLWFTAEAIRRFLAACDDRGGQMRIDGPFLEATAALQDLDDGRLPLWLVPAGKRREDVPVVTVDLAVDAKSVPAQHPALDGADTRPIPVTDAMAHVITHWVHLHRVNLLAWLAWGEGERRRITGSWWRTVVAVLAISLRARSFDPAYVAAAIGHRGRDCRVHPTAVIEASVLGDGVEVGPFAVIRGSWIGSGSKITEHARVAGSVVGERCTVARGTNLQLSVLLPHGYVSEGRGHQMCMFGRECFVAVGVTTFDLSFGREIDVDRDGVRVGIGTRFLGSAIGHRARIGPHVRIGYGEAIPNDALLIGDPDEVARHVPTQLDAGANVARDGRLQALKP